MLNNLTDSMNWRYNYAFVDKPAIEELEFYINAYYKYLLSINYTKVDSISKEQDDVVGKNFEEIVHVINEIATRAFHQGVDIGKENAVKDFRDLLKEPELWQK